MNGRRRFQSSHVCALLRMVAALGCLLVHWTGAGAGTEGRDGAGKGDLTPTRFKAAFLHKVPILASWPASAFPGTNTSIVIGVLGPDPFNGLLEKLTANQSVAGHPITVRMDVDALSVTNCHVLFVPADQQRRWLELRNGLGEGSGVGMLTIGEDPEFLASGGIIKLVPDKQVFELHLQNANALGDRLRLDPKLKRSAVKLVR